MQVLQRISLLTIIMLAIVEEKVSKVSLRKQLVLVWDDVLIVLQLCSKVVF